MKLTYKDKVQIYELRKQGYSLEQLSNKFGINNSNLRYMIKWIDRYGMEFVKKGKNRPSPSRPRKGRPERSTRITHKEPGTK